MKVVRDFVLHREPELHRSLVEVSQFFSSKLGGFDWPVMFGACCYPLPNLKGKSKAKFIDPRIYTRGMLRENETFEWKYRSPLLSAEPKCFFINQISFELRSSLEFSPSNPSVLPPKIEWAAAARKNSGKSFKIWNVTLSLRRAKTLEKTCISWKSLLLRWIVNWWWICPSAGAASNGRWWPNFGCL